jgi:transposase
MQPSCHGGALPHLSPLSQKSMQLFVDDRRLVPEHGPVPGPLTLKLTPEERLRLTKVAGRPGSGQAEALRARIVLACARGGTPGDVGRALGVDARTVRKWRARFVESRLDGLYDAERSGAPRQTPGEVEWLLTLTLLATPSEGGRWTTRSMAALCGISQSAVARAWKGFGVQPLPGGTRRRTEGLMRARFGALARLYLDPVRRPQVQVHREKSRSRLLRWLEEIEARTPPGERIEVILCECGPTAEAQCQEWMIGRPRFGLCLAPSGEKWFELAERWFSDNGSGSESNGSPYLMQRVEETLAQHDGAPTDREPFAWTSQGLDILRQAARAAR